MNTAPYATFSIHEVAEILRKEAISRIGTGEIPQVIGITSWKQRPVFIEYDARQGQHRWTSWECRHYTTPETLNPAQEHEE